MPFIDFFYHNFFKFLPNDTQLWICVFEWKNIPAHFYKSFSVNLCFLSSEPRDNLTRILPFIDLGFILCADLLIHSVQGNSSAFISYFRDSFDKLIELLFGHGLGAFASFKNYFVLQRIYIPFVEIDSSFRTESHLVWLKSLVVNIWEQEIWVKLFLENSNTWQNWKLMIRVVKLFFKEHSGCSIVKNLQWHRCYLFTLDKRHWKDIINSYFLSVVEMSQHQLFKGSEIYFFHSSFYFFKIFYN